jgi:hypothetical protein
MTAEGKPNIETEVVGLKANSSSFDDWSVTQNCSAI